MKIRVTFTTIGSSLVADLSSRFAEGKEMASLSMNVREVLCAIRVSPKAQKSEY